jgi:hypothetical protein
MIIKKFERNKYDLQKPHCRILLTAFIDIMLTVSEGQGTFINPHTVARKKLNIHR